MANTKAIAAFLDLKRRAGRAADAYARELAESVRKDARDNTPVDTGEARDGWRTRRVSEGVYEVSNPVKHALYLERGHSKKAPRGILGPALQRARQRSRGTLEATFNREVAR